MQNIFKKSLAVSAVSGLMLVGGAGIANADTGTTQDTQVNDVAQVNDNTITDSGNLSLENLLNGGVNVSDVASGNNVLSGVDADLTEIVGDILSGNDGTVNIDPETDTTIDGTLENDIDSTIDGAANGSVDADGSTQSTERNQGSNGLLGVLL
ncbi:hypothetical protein AC792_08585 [Arthrobacter sp. RIT-PI-e]|uniref:hypothetical protein n=1 Tax=Arthrobacter sp. RIT-PI-e TaxID=1681197 RepID=UPI0006767327|nr:hypothetical protein [Arthrobacter sp. RIT-PI-e]KNC19026.1 hypothetical protein AC792_08585 [Arthrobacter sp. RIT-PI-e]